MNVRTATAADRLDLAAMVEHFLARSDYGAFFAAIGGVTRDHVEQLVDTVLQLATLEKGVVFVAEDEGGLFGFLALVKLPHPLTGRDCADELAWWIEPDRRGALRAGPKLLDAAEAWGRTFRIDFLKMVAPFSQPDVGRFYAKRGYLPLETAYTKVL